MPSRMVLDRAALAVRRSPTHEHGSGEQEQRQQEQEQAGPQGGCLSPYRFERHHREYPGHAQNEIRQPRCGRQP